MSNRSHGYRKNSTTSDKAVPARKGTKHLTSIKRTLIILLVVSLIACAAALVALELKPSVGAQAANGLRNIAGPQLVAHIEAAVFTVQDAITSGLYLFGLQQAESPWGGSSTTLPETTQIIARPEGTGDLTPLPAPQKNTTLTPGEITTGEAEEQQGQEQSAITPSPTPFTWQLENLVAFGALEGEGAWLPYLYDPVGNTVARRTFLQPDPERPYTIVAMVAFDLNRTDLHYMLGFLEPSMPGGQKGTGLIPEDDREPGILLATFNGGFRSANGMFGAMADGIEALPPRDGVATIGIYRDGQVRIGNWGENIIGSPELVAWRQNCQLIIRDGQVSERVYSGSIIDWGASIDNQIVTRRSAIGLDKDARTLYYFAGHSLSMPILADAMLASGVHQGMLLDINNFWVMFAAIRPEGDKLTAEALLPDQMKDKVDRYLGASPDDFFYVTAEQR